MKESTAEGSQLGNSIKIGKISQSKIKTVNVPTLKKLEKLRKNPIKTQIPIEIESNSQNMKKLLKTSFLEGLPNSFIMADNLIILTAIDITLLSSGNRKLVFPFVYFTIFYFLFYKTINYSLNTSQAVLGSKLISAKRYNYVVLRFKQNIIIGFIFFVIFILIPNFFSSEFLKKILRTENLIADSSQKMITWALPAMLIMTISDSFKIFLQNHKKTQILGLTYVLLNLVILPLIFFVINVFEYQESSVGIILFFYELSGFFLCLYSARNFWEEEKMNVSLNFTRELGYFLLKFLGTFLTEILSVLILLLQYFILSQGFSDDHIIVYTLFTLVTLAIFYLSYGFSTQPQILIKRFLKMDMVPKAVEIMNLIYRIYFGIGLIFGGLCCLMFWGSEFCGFFGPEGSELRGLMSLGKYSLILKVLSQFLIFGFQIPLIESMNCGELKVFLYFIPYCCVSVSSYIFGVYFGWGVLGVLWSEAFILFYISLSLGGFFNSDIFSAKADDIVSGYKIIIKD